MDAKSGSLTQAFVDYIDNARQYLESDVDKEAQLLQEVRLHFTHFVRHLIRGMPRASRHCDTCDTFLYVLNFSFVFFCSSEAQDASDEKLAKKLVQSVGFVEWNSRAAVLEPREKV